MISEMGAEMEKKVYKINKTKLMSFTNQDTIQQVVAHNNFQRKTNVPFSCLP